MSYGQYPFWLKNQRDHEEGETSFLRRENEGLKKKIKDLEEEIKKLKEK